MRKKQRKSSKTIKLKWLLAFFLLALSIGLTVLVYQTAQQLIITYQTNHPFKLIIDERPSTPLTTNTHKEYRYWVNSECLQPNETKTLSQAWQQQAQQDQDTTLAQPQTSETNCAQLTIGPFKAITESRKAAHFLKHNQHHYQLTIRKHHASP